MATIPHVHTYDAQGRMTCCSLEEKIQVKTSPPPPQAHEEGDGHDHDHEDGEVRSPWREYLAVLISLALLLGGIVLEYWLKVSWFEDWVRLVWYLAAYIPVGLPVLKEAFLAIAKRQFFTEFLLMSIATAGAFFIGEYPEGVAVMVFYAVGELFQTAAVRRAKGNIKALLDQRPDEVTVLENGAARMAKAETIGIGSILQLKPGEKVALDGELLSENASFNTAALTGESTPDSKSRATLCWQV